VKIYGVRAMNNANAKPFYEEIAERSGGLAIEFRSIHLVADMFVAICYRESSPTQLVLNFFFSQFHFSLF
jgi:hypothetical protein